MRARNWDEFHAAMNRWGAPAENQVYADTHGNIGWIPGGLTPIRPNWDGLLPGAGRRPLRVGGLPQRRRAAVRATTRARGYVVTANENNIPPDHPASAQGRRLRVERRRPRAAAEGAVRGEGPVLARRLGADADRHRLRRQRSASSGSWPDCDRTDARVGARRSRSCAAGTATKAGTACPPRSSRSGSASTCGRRC